MWRPEENNVSWVRTLVGKATKTTDWLTEFCAGTCCTAKACMLLNQEKFAEWDLDSEVLSAAKPDFVPTVASQVLSPNSDIIGDKEMRAAA